MKLPLQLPRKFLRQIFDFSPNQNASTMPLYIMFSTLMAATVAFILLIENRISGAPSGSRLPSGLNH